MTIQHTSNHNILYPNQANALFGTEHKDNKLASEELINLLEAHPPLFDALLSGDIIGEFLKSQGTANDVEKLYNQLLELSYDYKIPAENLLEIFILFQQCDASSYSFLRNKFFSTDNNSEVVIGRELFRPLNGEGNAIYCDRNQAKLATFRQYLEEHSNYSPDEWKEKVSRFDLDHPENISLDDLEQLLAIRRNWRFRMHHAGVDKKADSEYQEFRQKMKVILRHKLPTRMTQVVNLLDHRQHCSDTNRVRFNLQAISKELRQKFPQPVYMNDKTYKRHVTAGLMNLAKPLAEKLRVLESITTLHGSSSATLAMMYLTGEFKLQCTGQLIKRCIAPMCGELYSGIDTNGVNQCNLSADTIRNIKRVLSYTQSSKHYDHNNNMSKFSSRGTMNFRLHHRNWSQSAVYILQLRQWDEENFRNIINVDEYVEALDHNMKELIEQGELLLKTLDHDYTDEEISFITEANASTQDTPASLEFLSQHMDKIKKNFSWVNAFEPAFKDWKVDNKYIHLALRAIVKQKIQGNTMENERQCIIDEIEGNRCRYQFLRDILTSESPLVRIPKDNTLITDLIESPVPVLFGSTTYIPKLHSLESEFLITEPTKLGQGGCDIIFTDTEQSKEKILEILPAVLRDEITVYLFEEVLDGIPFPLFHNPDETR